MKNHADRTALVEKCSISVLALNAARVGAVDDSVLRWSLATVTTEGPAGVGAAAAGYIRIIDDANGGSRFQILTPGVYEVEFMLPQNASTSTLLGLAKGGGGAGTYTGNPVQGTNGVIATSGPNTLAAATAQGQFLKKTVIVRDVDLGTENANIRMLATDNAGGPPAGVTVATAWCHIERVADIAA